MSSPKPSLLLLLLYVCIAGSSSSYSHVKGVENVTEFASPDERVNLTVYFESLSEPCATFVIRNLVEIFNKDLINIVNLQLVPWANASISNTILCQNGPDECQLNSLEACVLNVSNDVKFQSYNQLGLPKQPFLDCFKAGNGSLDYEHFVTYVCKAYKGPLLLPACHIV